LVAKSATAQVPEVAQVVVVSMPAIVVVPAVHCAAGTQEVAVVVTVHPLAVAENEDTILVSGAPAQEAKGVGMSDALHSPHEEESPLPARATWKVVMPTAQRARLAMEAAAKGRRRAGGELHRYR
jgi:hypothetical protein